MKEVTRENRKRHFREYNDRIDKLSTCKPKKQLKKKVNNAQTIAPFIKILVSMLSSEQVSY